MSDNILLNKTHEKEFPKMSVRDNIEGIPSRGRRETVTAEITSKL